jgi:uncharacterized protein YPO0396
MKKIISSVLLFSLLFSSQSFAATTLKEVLQNYTYSMEVEWDQVNLAQKEAINNEFQASLENLFEQQSPEALMKEALSSIQDPALKNEVQMKIDALKENRISPEEVTASLVQVYEKSQTQGANWSAIGTFAVGAVGVLAVAYLSLRIYMYFWGKKFGA